MCSVLPEIYRVKIDDDTVESFCGELNIIVYYIDTDEIPGVFHLRQNHIFTARSEDTIFIFHV